MRAIFVGATETAVQTAELLAGRGDEVVIIESDKDRIEEISENLDCGFLHGDGSRPTILQQVGPREGDILFCLTKNDQANIIASLVGRELGFGRVVTSIQDISFEPICEELGLTDVIVPNRTIARYLADMCEGLDVLELSSLIKHDGRLFSFDATEEDAGPISELDLPPDTRVICYYRGESFHVAKEGDRLKAGDEVVVITRANQIDDLCERWRPQEGGADQEPGRRG